jgi:hypothetical protein
MDKTFQIAGLVFCVAAAIKSWDWGVASLAVVGSARLLAAPSASRGRGAGDG